MNKLMAVLLSGCALLLLAGCPKPDSNGNPPDGKACGGVEGLVCPKEQYCSFPIGNCGKDQAQGTCEDIPKIGCRFILSPVCGCDGKYYPNPCKAAQAGVSIKHIGPCKKMCGGIANIQCPDGLTCVDDPDDNCNPAQGGADCSGVCVKP